MNRVHLLIATIAALLLPNLANADPCGMVPPIYTGPGVPIARTGDQNTYVFYKNGVETFVIHPGFKGKVEQFGMLIPFPAVPELRKVSDSIFPHVRAAIDPPEVVVYAGRFPRPGVTAFRDVADGVSHTFALGGKPTSHGRSRAWRRMSPRRKRSARSAGRFRPSGQQANGETGSPITRREQRRHGVGRHRRFISTFHRLRRGVDVPLPGKRNAPSIRAGRLTDMLLRLQCTPFFVLASARCGVS